MKKGVSQLKAEYINYYSDVPIQKYAAMFIGRDEDTLIRWRKKILNLRMLYRGLKLSDTQKSHSPKAEFALSDLKKKSFPLLQRLRFLAPALRVLSPTIQTAPENKTLVDEFTEFMMEKLKGKLHQANQAATSNNQNHAMIKTGKL
jgi:hypothetical protein